MPKSKIVTAFGKRPARPDVSEPGGPDATLEFAVEADVATRNREPQRNRRLRLATGAFLVLLVALAAAGVYWKDLWQTPAAAAASGSLRIESDPPGAVVSLNGAAKGTTPLSLTMPAGQYALTVQQGANLKQLPVAITSGAVTVHHITWADASPLISPESASLTVSTDTPGASVTVDGEDRGTSPLTLQNLSAGQHRVVVRSRGTTYTRTVQLEAGETASLVIGGAAGAASGWIAISSPVAVHVFEEQRLIGTSDMDRIMLPSGDHDLELVSEPVGYRTSRRVRVAAGQTETIALDLPRTSLSINAVPWAEVYIDGSRVGDTPLGNLSQTIGQHEIVFRHPQLGERRVTTVVTLKETNRVSMDMRPR
jgi:hypothetical protein